MVLVGSILLGLLQGVSRGPASWRISKKCSPWRRRGRGKHDVSKVRGRKTPSVDVGQRFLRAGERPESWKKCIQKDTDIPQVLLLTKTAAFGDLNLTLWSPGTCSSFDIKRPPSLDRMPQTSVEAKGSA